MSKEKRISNFLSVVILLVIIVCIALDLLWLWGALTLVCLFNVVLILRNKP